MTITAITRYLGDLKEATDFELLNDRHITAVLNLINWWELSSRLPEAKRCVEEFDTVGFLKNGTHTPLVLHQVNNQSL